MMQGPTTLKGAEYIYSKPFDDVTPFIVHNRQSLQLQLKRRAELKKELVGFVFKFKKLILNIMFIAYTGEDVWSRLY